MSEAFVKQIKIESPIILDEIKKLMPIRKISKEALLFKETQFNFEKEEHILNKSSNFNNNNNMKNNNNNDNNN